MMTPPVIVSRIWCYSASHSDVGRAHLSEYGFDLGHQVCCSIVGIRGPIVSQSADRVTVRIRVVRIKIDIVHEGRQIWGERSSSYRLFRWEVLVLLGSLESTTHCSVGIRSIRSAYTSGVGDIPRSSSEITT